MSNQREILEVVAESLTLPIADLDMDSSLQEDLGLNLVEVSDLLQDLSTKFKIVFEPTEAQQIKTVGDLVEVIEDKLLE